MAIFDRFFEMAHYCVRVKYFRCIWLEWFLWLFDQIRLNTSTSANTTCLGMSSAGLRTRNPGAPPSSRIWKTGRSSCCCCFGSAWRRITKTGLHRHWRASSNRRRRRQYGVSCLSEQPECRASGLPCLRISVRWLSDIRRPDLGFRYVVYDVRCDRCDEVLLPWCSL